MEPEDQLPCTNELAICAYYKPDPSSPYLQPILKIHFNIIFPPTPRSYKFSPYLRFPHVNPVHNFLSPIRPKHPPVSLLLIWSPEYLLARNLLTMQSHSFPCYIFPLRTNYLPQHAVLQRTQPMTRYQQDDKFDHNKMGGACCMNETEETLCTGF